MINEIIKLANHLATNVTAGEKWEALKLHIIANTQIYCQEHASNRKLILSQLEQAIEKFGKTGASVTKCS